MDFDILIAPKDKAIWTIYAPTAKGLKAMERYLKAYSPLTREDGLAVLHVSEKEGMAFYRKVRRYRIEDVDMYWFPDVVASYEEVELIARARAAKFREETIRSELAAYFGPKIDAAIEAKDGKEARRLVYTMPSNMGVEKSFIVMRICKEFDAKTIDDI